MKSALCNHCGINVVPTPANLCPACGNSIQSTSNSASVSAHPATPISRPSQATSSRVPNIAKMNSASTSGCAINTDAVDMRRIAKEEIRAKNNSEFGALLVIIVLSLLLIPVMLNSCHEEDNSARSQLRRQWLEENSIFHRLTK